MAIIKKWIYYKLKLLIKERKFYEKVVKLRKQDRSELYEKIYKQKNESKE